MPVALVTGSGIRLGRAIACGLAEAGFDLLLHASSSKAEVKQTQKMVQQKGRSAEIFFADFSKAQDIQKLAHSIQKKTSRLDLVVHNAAIFQRRPFGRISRNDYKKMLAINCDAPFFLTQHLLPLLRKSSNASVLFVLDAALRKPFRNYTHYMMSKGALLMMMQSLALELAPHVRCNGVGPGTISFPPDWTAEQKAHWLQRLPTRQAGTPEDIANAVVFLAQKASYVNGQMLCVDGGWSIS